MHFVKALVEGYWNIAAVRDSHGKPTGRRFLVRALEDSMWCLDAVGIEVEPGLVVGSSFEEDQKYFTALTRKQAPRGEIVSVVPGMIVAFENSGDAAHFVEIQQAEHMTDDDVADAMRAAHAEPAPNELSPGDDEMMKTKGIENKALQGPAPDTKKADAPKPVVKPKKK